MARYAYKAVSVRTGRVIADLPLTDVSAQCRLDFGQFGASMPLQGRDGDWADDASIERLYARNTALISATSPDITTIAVVRDGKVMGEWLTWGRTRTNGPEPVKLAGIEFGSWFAHVVVDGWTKRTDVDQLTVAHDLAQLAVDKQPGMSSVHVAPAGTSGNLLEQAAYPTGTEYIASIISELAGAVNGFDWWVESEWDTAASLPTIKRTVRFACPRRGRTLNALLEIPTRRGRSGVQFSLTEDGTRVATTVYMTGTGEGDKQLYSRGINADLFLAYPVLDKIDSRASYDVQSLLDAQTAAVAAASRSPELPTAVNVLADGDLQLGTYAPGDTLSARMRRCPNFPSGLTTGVRIIGYTLTPPAAGPETVEVEIGRDDASVFDT